jgi:hypothetical protein
MPAARTSLVYFSISLFTSASVSAPCARVDYSIFMPVASMTGFHFCISARM